MSLQAPPTHGAPSGMTDLEERLQASDGAEVRAALLSRLAHLDGAVGAMVRRGLARGGFERAQAIQGAIQAAQNFLAKRR